VLGGLTYRLGSNADWTSLSGGFGAPTLQTLTGSTAAMITVDPDDEGPLPPELWIGGAFSAAGGRPAGNFARWRLTGAIPVITQAPIPASPCSNTPAQFTLAADGSGAPITYQWRIEDSSPTGWLNMVDGPITASGRFVGTASGAMTPSLTFTPAAETSIVLQCLVSTPCGSIRTAPLPLSTIARCCGSGDFNHDGDLGTDQDILAFFVCLSGNCCATCDSMDFNADGDYGTDQDIEAFFRVLAGGGC
jgi:hypothetical protein